MKKAKEKKLNSIFLYLLAIALALLIYSFLVIKLNTTGKVISENKNIYTNLQVQQHNNAGDCWTINNNNVYDVTGLMDNINFKEKDCGKEIYLNNYFQEVLKSRKVGILS